jgi:hypothetical protein
MDLMSKSMFIVQKPSFGMKLVETSGSREGVFDGILNRTGA